jgi:ribosomal-protein-alanine N-acetyltransferase
LQTHARNIAAVAFFQKHGYSVNWLSVDYSPRLDRNVESIGLRRQLVADLPIGYGPGGF